MDNSPQAAPLKPCPFCGETPTLDSIVYDDAQGKKWGYVQCCCHGPEVRTGYLPITKWADKAIVAWNERAPDTEAAERIAALEASLSDLRQENTSLLGECRVLQGERDAALRDAARLNWLNDNCRNTVLHWVGHDPPVPYGEVTTWAIDDYPWQLKEHGNIREAIDFAMKNAAIDAARSGAREDDNG